MMTDWYRKSINTLQLNGKVERTPGSLHPGDADAERLLRQASRRDYRGSRRHRQPALAEAHEGVTRLPFIGPSASSRPPIVEGPRRLLG